LKLDGNQCAIPLNLQVAQLVRFGKQPVSFAGGARYCFTSRRHSQMEPAVRHDFPLSGKQEMRISSKLQKWRCGSVLDIDSFRIVKLRRAPKIELAPSGNTCCVQCIGRWEMKLDITKSFAASFGAILLGPRP
jgi:hypothetical protein